MSQADRIIEKFGGLSAMARAIDPDMHVSVVGGWRARGFIPAPRHQEVLDAAKRAGVALGHSDFFDHEEAAE